MGLAKKILVPTLLASLLVQERPAHAMELFLDHPAITLVGTAALLTCCVWNIARCCWPTHPQNLYCVDAQQGLRKTMEDEHDIKITRSYAFFGLYDGHGGRSMSGFAKNFMRSNIVNSDSFADNPARAITEGYQKTHLSAKPYFDTRDSHARIAENQGTTALTCIIKDDTLYIGNAGDSRAVLCRDDETRQITTDHRPDNPKERERIFRLGGTITHLAGDVARVCGLGVSRAIGDLRAAPYVTSEPDTFTHKLEAHDKFLIMACDGVWDAVIDNNDAASAIHRALEFGYGFADTAHKLADHAIQNRQSTDNVTVIVIDLHALRKHFGWV